MFRVLTKMIEVYCSDSNEYHSTFVCNQFSLMLINYCTSPGAILNNAQVQETVAFQSIYPSRTLDTH